MSQTFADDRGFPTVQQLTAYVDGNLDERARRLVEAWLSTHPEAAAEVEAHRRLCELWHAAPAPEPGEREWARVLSRVETALSATPPARAPQQGPGMRPAYRRWLATAAAAAAVLLAAVFFSRQAGNDEGMLGAAGAFPVVSAQEVEIISMDAADLRAVVVGEPPLREPLILAAVGDVRFERIAPGEDGVVPRVQDGPTVPMIVVPLDGTPAKDP